MNNIQGINNYGGPNAIPPTGSREAGAAPEPATPAEKADQVEISSVGRYLQKIAMLPDIRAEKVEEVRQGLAPMMSKANYPLPWIISSMNIIRRKCPITLIPFSTNKGRQLRLPLFFEGLAGICLWLDRDAKFCVSVVLGRGEKGVR